MAQNTTLTIEERVTALEAIFLNQKEILTFKEACVYTGIKPQYTVQDDCGEEDSPLQDHGLVL